MATDHRGNPINENNLPKTNKDRIYEGSNFGPRREGEPSDAEYLDAEMYFAELDEYPEQEESEEQMRASEQYAEEMREHYRMMQTPDRVYGKDEMIELDRDDDKY